MTLEHYFTPFRNNIVGIDQSFLSPSGEQKIVYADWTASGRLYGPIEHRMLEQFGPFVGNTHSEASVTGSLMTSAYHHAHTIIKRHVNAGADDALLFVGTGMTAGINKLQRILGVKAPEQFRSAIQLREEDTPVVFVTHMEHHSNQTTWYETLADVHVLAATEEGLVDVNDLRSAIEIYKHRRIKIGSFTACSNVTGIQTPYHTLASIMHDHGGIAIVDFAASAPYVAIDMHPADERERLDAIIFSPHKFLGGPGTPGVLILHKDLYTLKTPDQPGGGTVLWTNPWGEHRYLPDIEMREDGGTPGFLQAVKASLAVALKEEMGVDRIAGREQELRSQMFGRLRAIKGLHILAGHCEERLPVFSFYIRQLHYNMVVRLLNDRYGIQARGGCSCAGTYGHYLLHVDKEHSQRITNKIDHGDLSAKPGWVRISL
ncbi:MAG TPA: aminotransferase class V-fold PLP-dependent enzyme, partial [Bacteroidota bacterium]|nr:aminotransferase class V-fold PLP-dependent enzyme [Bacteroidota bacterium]